jgi:hypothetical protein
MWQDGSLCALCLGCGTFLGSSGTFSDGSGPADYSSGANCKWIISPTNAVQITITFRQLSIESGFDFVRIYECTDANCGRAQLLAELSGTYALSQSITSSTGYMAIWFTSDGSFTGPGFSASWTSLSSLPVSIPLYAAHVNVCGIVRGHLHL